MIPDFNDDGNLPAGIYQATLEEIAARFGKESELRTVQLESLQWLVDLARRAGARRLIVNGSFVTDRLEPNDVDCALLIGSDFPMDADAEAELLAGLPFIDLHLLSDEVFEDFVQRIYGSDRQDEPKGMIEVSL